MPTSQHDKATAFRALHQGPRAFLIANAWDGGSARALAALGFPALATSSGAQAGVLGRRDGSVTRDEALAHCRTIVAATDLPVSADLEKGFSDAPQAVAETIRLPPAAHPRVIVGNVTAFGARGPDAGLAGMDLVVQGRSGLMVTGGRVKDGLPTTGESPIADYMAAALLAFGVAGALYRRERTGRGGRVDTSLLLAALALQNNLMVRVDALDGPRHAAFREWLTRARAGGVPFTEQVERMPRNRVVASQAVYIRTYATKDAALAVACGSPSLRRKFLTAIGHEDPALREPAADLEGHYAALRAAVEATMASRTTQEWKAVLDGAGVPASGVALPVEILDDPQPAANAMFQRFEHPTLGPITVLGPPVQVSDGGFVPGAPTPPFGSEVRALLAWAGFAERDVERLLAGGAVTP